MDCRYVTDNLHEYIYDELDTSTRDKIEEHLKSCESCHTEHNNLRKLLIDEAQSIFEFSGSIKAPLEIMQSVRSSIKIRRRVRPLKYIAVACILTVFIYTLPVFAYYAAQVFPLDKYVGFLDGSMIADFKEGRGQVIGKSFTQNGVTLTVDGMIKNEGKYNIIFTLKLPKYKYYDLAFPAGGTNALSVFDQFGRQYMVGSAAGRSIEKPEEGECQYILEIDEPISFWSYKLKVRLTSIELSSRIEKNRKSKNIYGNWSVEFYIDRKVFKGV